MWIGHPQFIMIEKVTGNENNQGQLETVCIKQKKD